MNVSVENLAACKRLIRVEVESSAVDAAFDHIAAEYQKQAKLPGFRPGKAPKDMVLKRYEKEIEDEARNKAVAEAYRAALKKENLEAVGSPDLEIQEFGRGKNLQFTVTTEVAPQFELPPYKGLQLTREQGTVTEKDIDEAIDMLRNRAASFETVERPAESGDIVVVNYTGTVDGKPITELAPAARGLTEQKGFWIQTGEDTFIPGFADQLMGKKTGEKVTVEIDFPQDFVTPQLVGKHGTYEVEVVEVKKKNLPELDVEFAKSFGAEDMHVFREGIRRDLQNEMNFKQARDLRNNAYEALLKQVEFDLPESMVQNETRQLVYRIVYENQRRGVAKESIEERKDEIYKNATHQAKDRVKGGFIIGKIAEKEGIRVSREELSARIEGIARAEKQPAQKVAKQLEENGQINNIVHEILMDKVLDLVQRNATFQDVPQKSA